jgi:nucleotide-binding universal stress UspA family protein
MRVLIGYDGSDCADRAIQDLRRAGLPRETEAMVLSVADSFPAFPPTTYPVLDPAAAAGSSPAVRQAHSLTRQALKDAESTAAQGAEKVRLLFPTWTVEHAASMDSPYRELVMRADRWRPDLLIVGSNGRTAVGRAILGSVAQKVLHHAICSVRISRVQDNSMKLDTDTIKLVLGIDGSADSAAAVSAVAGRNWPAGTEVYVVTAVDLRIATLPYWYGTPIIVPTDPDNDRSWANRAAENAARELKEAGLAAEARVVEGDPKHVLIEQARQLNADCIFIGAKGHSRMERFLLGSVSSAIAARAECSVEVVRHG